MYQICAFVLYGWSVLTVITLPTFLENAVKKYRWTWTWQTQWDQENWSVICKIRRIHMTNAWYASDWDQAYRPSYAIIRHTVVRHIQVHLYRWTWIWRTKWDQENWSVICKIRHMHTTDSVRHMQVCMLLHWGPYLIGIKVQKTWKNMPGWTFILHTCVCYKLPDGANWALSGQT